MKAIDRMLKRLYQLIEDTDDHEYGTASRELKDTLWQYEVDRNIDNSEKGAEGLGSGG